MSASEEEELKGLGRTGRLGGTSQPQKGIWVFSEMMGN